MLKRWSIIRNRKRLAGICILLASGALFLAVYLSFDHIPSLVVMFLYVEILIGSGLDFIGQLEERDRKKRGAEQKSEAGLNGTV
jgi:hypothetical protein